MQIPKVPHRSSTYIELPKLGVGCRFPSLANSIALRIATDHCQLLQRMYPSHRSETGGIYSARVLHGYVRLER